MGLDQRLACPMQKQIVSCLFCSLLDLSLAGSRALATWSCCSCSVCVGISLVMRPVHCKAWKFCGLILSSGGFLFVSVIVVSPDDLSWTPEGMALKHAFAQMLSALKHLSCQFGLRCTQNCEFLESDQTRSVSRHAKMLFVLIDIFESSCTVGISLLDPSSHPQDELQAVATCCSVC